MVRSGEWKLWEYPTESDIPPAMFNLEEDPQERRDLGTDPEYAEIREELLETLYADWNPETVERESTQLGAWREVLSGWHKAVGPEFPAHVTRSELVSSDDEELVLL
jgi:hypothetical protein